MSTGVRRLPVLLADRELGLEKELLGIHFVLRVLRPHLCRQPEEHLDSTHLPPDRRRAPAIAPTWTFHPPVRATFAS
jgi:hypothetical protein